MPLGKQRIFLAAILAIPLMVIGMVLICDLFHHNKPEYIRSIDNTIGGIIGYIITYSLMTVFYLGVPSLLYGWLLEHNRNHKMTSLILRISFGVIFGVICASFFKPSLVTSNQPYFWEGFSHILITAISIGALLPVIINKTIKPANESQ